MRKRKGANKEVVSLIVLLHDVDDYKLFGMEYAKNLTNARRIMNECGVDIKIQEQACDALDNIGYNKRLKGCFPSTIEGKVVSDTDMCDTLGSNGILRTCTYNMKKRNAIF